MVGLDKSYNNTVYCCVHDGGYMILCSMALETEETIQ